MSRAFPGQCVFRSMPYLFSALLCIMVGVGGVAEKRGGTTNLQRLHFLAPLLAGSQLGLVLGERLKESGREKPRHLPLLLPCAVSLAADVSSPLFYSCRTSLFSWFRFRCVVPILGSKNMASHPFLSSLALVDTLCCCSSLGGLIIFCLASQFSYYLS